jgi:hypothetical protein
MNKAVPVYLNAGFARHRVIGHAGTGGKSTLLTSKVGKAPDEW